jgi:hypothetical protein
MVGGRCVQDGVALKLNDENCPCQSQGRSSSDMVGGCGVAGGVVVHDQSVLSGVVGHDQSVLSGVVGHDQSVLSGVVGHDQNLGLARHTGGETWVWCRPCLYVRCSVVLCAPDVCCRWSWRRTGSCCRCGVCQGYSLSLSTNQNRRREICADGKSVVSVGECLSRTENHSTQVMRRSVLEGNSSCARGDGQQISVVWLLEGGKESGEHGDREGT